MLSALLLLASLAQAQDDAPAAEEAAEAPPEVDVNLEVGGSYTDGNSVSSNLYGAMMASWRQGDNGVKARGFGNYGSNVVDRDGNGRITDDERERGHTVSTRRAGIEGRYDRFLSDKDSVFAELIGFTDRFAGFNLRLQEGLGYSRILVDAKRTDDEHHELSTQLDASIQANYVQEWYDDGDVAFAHFPAISVKLGLAHDLTEETKFSNTLTVWSNLLEFEDTRITNAAALSTTLSGAITLRVSHNVVYYNKPVDPLLRKVDHTLLASMVVDLK